MGTPWILHLQCFAFWLFRIFYSVDAQHAIDGKHSLNNYFHHFGHCVYEIFISFIVFEIAVWFCTYWLLRISNAADSHHPNYSERCSIHHFRHWAHCVCYIYSVFKRFEIAGCFSHFGFNETSTPLIRTLLTMVNVVQIMISDIGQTVYITFTVFSNFSILQFVLNIFAFTKFLLRGCASW